MIVDEQVGSDRQDVGGRENAETRKGKSPAREVEESDGRVSERRRLAEGTGVMRAITVDARPRAKSPIEAIADAAYTKVLELKASGVRMSARVETSGASMLDVLASLVSRPEEVARGSSAALTLESVELTADESLDLDLDIADGVELDADDDIDDEVPATSKRVRRRTKRNRPRSKTIAMKRVTRAELQAGALMYPPVEDVERPRTRAQCKEEARPCPWVSCKHHLYLDINPETGSIKINFPDLEPWEMQHTCSLDVAEAGALTLEEIGLITNLTRERIRQVEVRGLLKLQGRRELR